jgi:hypothetical protein
MKDAMDNPNLEYGEFCNILMDMLSIFSYDRRFIQWNNTFYEGSTPDEDTILGGL